MKVIDLFQLLEMSGYRRVNFQELCRLCTSSEGTKYHIFKEDGKHRQLSTKIQMCLPVQINEDDSLPKTICSNCVDKLESFMDFRTSCMNAETMLEGYLNTLRYNNNDFSKEGKVYVKDINPIKNSENETVKRIELSAPQIPTQEIHLQLPTSSQVKVSSSENQSVTTVPVTIDNFSNLVQTAAIQIVSQADAEQVRLQQYKCAVQIQNGTTMDTSSNDNRFTFQTCTSNDQNSTSVLKPMEAQSFVEEKQTERTEEESSEDEESETGVQPTYTITSNSVGQDVLVQLDFKEETKDQTVYQTKSTINRNSMVQIEEFLRVKTMGVETEEEEEDDEDEEGTETCDKCGKQLSSETEKSSHSLTCTQTMQDDKSLITSSFACDECGKPFKRKEHLFQHKKLHTGERPFLCVRCGKAFSRKEHLVRHSVSHTGQKQYACDICGKTFGRKDNVRKHRKTHGVSGPYACENCGKTFVVKPYYLMHKASCSNSGESESDSYPYKCDVCNKRFSVKKYLTTHKLRHRNKGGAQGSTGESATPLTDALAQAGQLFQLSNSSTPTTYISTLATANQLIDTYRKLSSTS